MKRHIDWQTELAGFLEKASKKKFRWASHDCCMFACNAVRAITGVDLARGYRTRYRTWEDADAVLEQGGGVERISEDVARRNGLIEIPILFARRGDVILFETEMGKTLGIVGMDGKHIVSAGLKGLGWFPVRQGLKAWRV